MYNHFVRDCITAFLFPHLVPTSSLQYKKSLYHTIVFILSTYIDKYLTLSWRRISLNNSFIRSEIDWDIFIVEWYWGKNSTAKWPILFGFFWSHCNSFYCHKPISTESAEVSLSVSVIPTTFYRNLCYNYVSSYVRHNFKTFQQDGTREC